MFKYFTYCFSIMIFFSCNNNESNTRNENTNSSFNNFQPRFLDAYWKENPSAAIFVGYGKYYDELVIPDSTAFAKNISFSKT